MTGKSFGGLPARCCCWVGASRAATEGAPACRHLLPVGASCTRGPWLRLGRHCEPSAPDSSRWVGCTKKRRSVGIAGASCSVCPTSQPGAAEQSNTLHSSGCPPQRPANEKATRFPPPMHWKRRCRCPIQCTVASSLGALPTTRTTHGPHRERGSQRQLPRSCFPALQADAAAPAALQGRSKSAAQSRGCRAGDGPSGRTHDARSLLARRRPRPFTIRSPSRVYTGMPSEREDMGFITTLAPQ